MNETLKRSLKVGAILCAIGAGSAISIAGVNLLTVESIAKNKTSRILSALKEIYPDALSLDEEMTKVSSPNGYVSGYWGVALANENMIDAYVFQGEGKNSYGSITLLVGIETDGKLGTINLVTNSESYADVVQEKYVDVYNASDNKAAALEDTKCGATYAATLVKNIVNDAQAVLEGLVS